MICTNCAEITIDYTKLKDDTINLKYDRTDSYPDLPGLATSAAHGCQFCDILQDAIRTKLHDKALGGPEIIRIYHADFVTEGYFQGDLDEDANGVRGLNFLLSHPSAVDDVSLHFTIAAVEGSKAADLAKVHRRPINPCTNSASFSKLILGWIEECEDTHSDCGPNEMPLLPFRVIDVGKADGKQSPYLLHSEGRKGLYVALSHCWGPPSPNNPMLKTEHGNLADRLRAIPTDSMPQNFQDAVVMTRLLGVQYLWIDALCIIQDSKSDWEREGATMNEVYKNAHVTIAATSARTSSAGFLERSPVFERQILLPFLSKDGERCLGEFYVHGGDKVVNDFEQSVELSAWNQRGWTLQERYLSTRILHFCKYQAYFECRTLFRAGSNTFIPFAPPGDWMAWEDADIASSEGETCSLDDYSGNVLITANADIISVNASAPLSSSDSEESIAPKMTIREAAYEKWWFFIGQYSDRQLTYPNDKLPALSGLAQEIGRITNDRYLAGLWEGNLAQGLLWCSAEPINERRRPEAYRGPSWSWISMDGQVTTNTHWSIPEWHSLSRQWEPLVRIIKADIITAPGNPYGVVEKAVLKVCAKILPVTSAQNVDYKKPLRSWPEFPYKLLYNGAVMGAGHFDLEQPQVLSKELSCLQVEPQLEEDRAPCCGLLIEEVGDQYRRIGLFFLTAEHISVFDNVEQRVIELI